MIRTPYAVAGDRSSLAEDSLQAAFAKAHTSWDRVQGAQHPEAHVRLWRSTRLSAVRRPWYRAERSTEVPESGDPLFVGPDA